MTTNADVIRDALGLLGVVAETEEASEEQAQLGLRILNDFMEEWLANGIDVGQWPQTDVDDEFPGPSGVIQTTKATLAIHLAPYFERQPSAIVVATASAGYNRLMREAFVGQMQERDLTHLPMGSGWSDDVDIVTGE